MSAWSWASRAAASRTIPWIMMAALSGLLSLGVMGARAQEGTTDLPKDPLAGKQVFFEKGCNKCHAIWGEGGTLGPDLGSGGVWHSAMQLAGVLWNHSPAMIEKMRERHIPRPVISSAEMADLAAFLYFLDYFDPLGDPSRGAQLFAEKGCQLCHSVGGNGGSIGPGLDKYKRFASPLFLVGAMWAHGPAMAEKVKELGVRRPQFAGTDLAHIFAYLQAASTDPSTDKMYILPGSPATGREVFGEKGCPQCHAVWGVGGKIGPDLGQVRLQRSVTEIAGLMWNHQPGMAAKMKTNGVRFPQFTDQEIPDLLAYLFFAQYFDQPGDATKGQGLYIDKGCILCHYAPERAEKRLAPDLSRSPALSSPLALASAMWNHAPVMESQFRERGFPWPRFQGDEVRDLVAYLRSTAPSQAAGR